MATKECRRCQRFRELEQFHNDASRIDGKYPWCKDCRKEYPKHNGDEVRRAEDSRRRYLENPEAAKERSRENRYLQRYGITIADYQVMLAYQGGVCAICDRPPKKQRLQVDHDHVTGICRGLTCFTCNALVLGRQRDPLLFARASEYLADPPSPKALGRAAVGYKGPVTSPGVRKPRRSNT